MSQPNLVICPLVIGNQVIGNQVIGNQVIGNQVISNQVIGNQVIGTGGIQFLLWNNFNGKMMQIYLSFTSLMCKLPIESAGFAKLITYN